MFLVKFPLIRELVYGNGPKKNEKSEENNQSRIRRTTRLRQNRLTSEN